MSLSGHAGFAVEWANAADTEVNRIIGEGQIYGLFGLVGAQLAINLKYNCQLVGGVSYYAELGDAELTKGSNSEEASKGLMRTYSEIFKGRARTNINVGVRIQF